MLFFFNDTATTEIYTLSLHDALPISVVPASPSIKTFAIAVFLLLRGPPGAAAAPLPRSSCGFSPKPGPPAPVVAKRLAVAIKGALTCACYKQRAAPSADPL